MDLFTAMYRQGGLGGNGLSASIFESGVSQKLSSNTVLNALQVMQYGPRKDLYDYPNSMNGFHESSRYEGGCMD